jgi:F0F1-type ATP synthase membrane subunit c/vacuolar-type H+-ATPase subunit K
MTGSQPEKNKLISHQHALIIGLSLIASVTIMGIISYMHFVTIDMSTMAVKKIYSILNMISVAIILLILVLRKKVYFSKRITDGDLNQEQIIGRWYTTDIILMALAEQISIFGLVLSFMGMPFRQLFHFFVTSGLLMLILFPNRFRTESRLQALKEDSPRTIC